MKSLLDQSFPFLSESKTEFDELCKDADKLIMKYKKDKMLNHYVKILYPGSFVSEESNQKIELRKDFVLPKGAYGYQFYDREYVVANGEELLGQPKHKTKTFIKGIVYTLEEVKRLFPESRTLISNMEINKWDKVVKCAQGFLPFIENDYELIEQ